jgi:methionine-S-sulfoxide reductase
MNSKNDEIYLAGGCYWGLEKLLIDLSGVNETEVGFVGGHVKNVCYKEVTKGDTGHAETVKVNFDSSQLSLEDLLRYFFKIHDPTTLNQQGNDRGSQYRSAIFYTHDNQRIIAEEIIQLVNQSSAWNSPILTEIEKFDVFYPAEESHQKYLQKNPDGYSCHFIRKLSF